LGKKVIKHYLLRYHIHDIFEGQTMNRYHIQILGILFLSILFLLPSGNASYLHPSSTYSTLIESEQMSLMNDVFEGYTLFGPEYSTYTYLLNTNGRIIHFWKSEYIQGFGTYLMENGDLFRLDLPFTDTYFFGGGVAGRVEKFNEDSQLLWEFEYSNTQVCSHHDIEPLPNGNVLLIAWELKSKEDAIQAGRDPSQLRSDELWPDHIIEVQPIGTNEGQIVWEWHLWDHLIQDYDPSKDNYGIVSKHPELVDINYGNTNQDWTHINAVDYNEELDQILLSVHNLNEIWIIDHSTTTKEAKGHTGGQYGKGGDILYRWGNPQTYRAGTQADQQYYGQHGANWIASDCPGAGNILVFNNGGQNRNYASVDEIVPPLQPDGTYAITVGEAFAPAAPIWVYTKENPQDMQSRTLSSAQRLPNGNTLICSANQGKIFEVTAEKETVWTYTNILPLPYANAVAMARKYPLNYTGLPEAYVEGITKYEASIIHYLMFSILSFNGNNLLGQ